MTQIITKNLFSAARAGQQIEQARQTEQGSAMALLNSLKGVSDTTYTIAADEFNKEMKIQEEAAIQQAVTDGTIAVKPDQYEADTREGHTAYDKAYNKASQAQVASNISVLARTRTAELAEQYKDDPDAFKGASVGLFESISEDYNLPEQTQAMLFQELTSEMGRYMPSIAANGYQKQKATQLAAQTEEYNTVSNIGLNTIRSGNLKAYEKDRLEVANRLDIMLSEGQINQQQYNESLNSFDKEAAAQLVIGNVERPLVKNDLTLAMEERNTWEKDMREAGLLSPDEIDKELNRVDNMIAAKQRAMKTETENYSRVQQSLETGAVMDYKDTKDKKAVNYLTEKTLGKNPDFSNPDVRRTASTIATKTGVVPEALLSDVRKSQFSDNPDVVMTGITTMQSLLTQRPEFKDQFDSKDIKFADSVTGFMNMGMPNEKAIALSREAQTTSFKDLQEVNLASIGSKEDYNSQVTKGLDNYLDNNLYKWTEFGEEISPEQQAGLRGDYDRLFKYHLGTTANVEGAKAATERDLRNKYGVTYINGKRELTAYPVEQMSLGIPSEQVAEDNPVTKQVQADFKEIARSQGRTKTTNITGTTQTVEKVDTSHLQLQPTGVVKQGVPVYQVYEKDDNGVFSPLTDTDDQGNITFKYWKYDTGVAAEAEQAEKDETVAEAQAKHQAVVERQAAIDEQIKQTTLGVAQDQQWGAMSQRRF